MIRRAVPLVMSLLLGGCAVLQRVLPARDAADRLAEAVTITRDEWGVPHIEGESDAAAVFGLAYAQAEDNYWQIEEDYIHALGRAAHWYGERYLAADMLKAAFEVERLSREEYEREPPHRRALWDAFAAGINHYIRSSGTRPRLITRFEPWMPFALFRGVGAGTTVDGVRLGAIASLSTTTTAPDTGSVALVGAWDDDATLPAPPSGSNMWAIAPSRSASGHALLFQNPHVDFFGAGQRYEMHIRSASGWHVRGFAILGTPIPRAGHNEHLAWSHTNSGADRADVYEITFDRPGEPLAYRYDGEWRTAVQWADTLRVNTGSGVVSRIVTFRRTHHGPIVAERDGRALAVRMARMQEGGALQQWYDMGRARSLEQFRAALDQRALAISNTMVADVEGNIYYLHGNAVPVRDTTFDWTRPVDGSTSRTEWRGYHSIDELPWLLNPAGGWLQNTNSTPFQAAPEGYNLDPARYPGYMAREADNGRARASRRLLSADSAWTLDALARAAFDTFVDSAEEQIGLLAQEWEDVGGRNPTRARALDAALDSLRDWDGRAAVGSAATTLFMLWQERLRAGEYSGELIRFRALEDVIARLEQDWGRPWVKWGEVNRLQRRHTSGRQAFSDSLPSLPVAGAPGWTGVIFAFSAQRPASSMRRYGTAGHTWVSVVELAPQVRSRSVVTFGQSADSTSAHFFDQAPLYARGELKAAHFSPEDVKAHARRTYRPPALRR
jgi:acyl-homoserine-lactone acylase